MKALILLLAVLATACATFPEKIQASIDESDFIYAVDRAQKYVTEEPDGEYWPQVVKLLERARFGKALQEDTVDAYVEFLKIYPGSEFKPQIMKAYATARYHQYTKMCDTFGAYQEFIQAFPDSPEAELAKARSEHLAFRMADEKGGEEYRRFLMQYPTGTLRNVAETKLQAEGLRLVEANASPSLYASFSGHYQDSPLAAPVRVIGEAFGWKEAQAKDSAEGYYDFRTTFPETTHVPEFYPRELELAWARAEQRDSQEGYEVFRTRYPDSPFADLAEQRERDWAYFNAPAESQWPQVRLSQVNDLDPNSVWLYLDVRDQHNGVVGGLKKESFTVFENGRRAEIVNFVGIEDNRPIDIVFLIDLSGSMSDEIDAVKRSIIAFAQELKISSRDFTFGLVTYCDRVEAVFGKNKPATEAGTFQSWTSAVRTINQGTENPAQALWRATGYRFRKDAQKVFVLITDEPPNVPFDQVTRKTMAQMGEELAALGIQLIAVTPNHPEYLVPVETTKGMFFDIEEVERSGSFEQLMDTLVTILARQYLVAFKSPRGIPSGQPRHVKVAVSQQQVWIASGKGPAETVALLTTPAIPCKWWAATAKDGLYLSTNCGRDWALVDHVKLKTGFTHAVGPIGGAIWLLTTEGRVMLYSEKGECKDVTPGSGKAWAIGWRVASPAGVWVVMDDGLWVMASADSAFQKVPGELPVASPKYVRVTPNKQGLGCIWGQDGRPACNLTGQWQQVAMPAAPAAANQVDIEFVPGDPMLMFMRIGNLLYRTTDGGKSWRPVTLPGFDPATGVLGGMVTGLADGAFCISTQVGPYCSRDRGLSFLAHGDGVHWTQAAQPPVLANNGKGGLQIVTAAGTNYSLYSVSDRQVVAGDVYFDSGKDKPNSELIPHLMRLGSFLASNPDVRVNLEGHTDSDGPDEFNLDLSQRRSAAVQTVLLSAGARAGQISTAGYGETKPLVPNTTAANKKKNRRVEILLIRPPKT